MRNATVLMVFLLLVLIPPALPAMAEPSASPIEQAMSSTLDLWREGHYEQLFERLSHRGKTTREQFVRMMRDAPIRPACCWQKIENFRLLKEKRSTATAYAKVGLEGTPSPTDSSTREFKFSYEDGDWRMQLKDILDLAGAKAKKVRRSHPTVHRYN
jgi:hypothetical protein